MSEIENWRRGITLNTSRTKHWILADRQANDRIEQTMIFSDFHDFDEGRSRQLVCTLNPQHPEYETNVQLIAAAPKLLAACKEAYKTFCACSFNRGDVAWVGAKRLAAVIAEAEKEIQ
jgi:hypothetical protein